MREIFSSRTDDYQWPKLMIAAIESARAMGAERFMIEVNGPMVEMRPQYGETYGTPWLSNRVKTGEYEHKWHHVTVRVDDPEKQIVLKDLEEIHGDYTV